MAAIRMYLHSCQYFLDHDWLDSFILFPINDAIIVTRIYQYRRVFHFMLFKERFGLVDMLNAVIRATCPAAQHEMRKRVAMSFYLIAVDYRNMLMLCRDYCVYRNIYRAGSSVLHPHWRF